MVVGEQCRPLRDSFPDSCFPRHLRGRLMNAVASRLGRWRRIKEGLSLEAVSRRDRRGAPCDYHYCARVKFTWTCVSTSTGT